MSVLLKRQLTLETVEIEKAGGVDGQGLPSYDSGVGVNARVVKQDKLTVKGDGSEIMTQLTVWVDPEENDDVIPEEQDRVTHAGETYIVAEFKEVKMADASVGHVRARCRRV